MYGTIRKSYSAARNASNASENKTNKSLLKKKNKAVIENQEVDDLQQTRYIRVDEVKKANQNTNVKTEKKEESKNIINKNEFPVASVILTIVLTMMAMILAFGGI